MSLAQGRVVPAFIVPMATDQTEEPRYRFELLSARHDVSHFCCGNTWLDLYLKNDALDETYIDIARTFVLIDSEASTEKEVIGYITLRAENIQYMDGASHKVQDVPLVKLAYLARDMERKGEGFGDALLLQAFQYTASASELIAISGMHLTYTDEGYALYERHGFGDHPYGTDFLLISIADIREIVQRAMA